MRLTIILFFFLLFCNSIIAQEQDTLSFKLILAAEKGDEKEVLNLLKAGVNVNVKTDYDSITPLMYAAQNGHLAIAKILIYNGADVNAHPYDGSTALISAARFEQEDMVDLLIHSGANINDRDNDSVTALMFAAAYGYYIVTDMLLFYDADLSFRTNDGTDAIIIAAMNGNKDVVELLINKGANINSADSNGFTPLLVAAQNGYVDVIKLLLEKGANANLRNKNNFSALDIAIQNNFKEIVDVLINKGVAINDNNSQAPDPLKLAYSKGNYDIAKLLRKNGAKGGILPYFNRMSIEFDATWNFHDVMWGFSVGIEDARYKMHYGLGFNTRIGKRRILEEYISNHYYQYWEKRSLLHFTIEKRFNLKTSTYSQKGIYAGAKEIYTYGNYDGTSKKVDDKFIFVPQLGLGIYWIDEYAALKLGYEYMDFKLTKVSPHRISMSSVFYINIKKYKQSLKTVYWL